jgi:sugar O-acyltransferase (sialic acid O-acetyltransferase NeuD family)
MENLPLYILGAGGQAGKAATSARLLGYTVKGFISTEPIGKLKHGTSVLGKMEDCEIYINDSRNQFHISIGEPFIRTQIAEYLNKYNSLKFPSLRHLYSYVASAASIGLGCYTGAQAVIEHQAVLGNHCLIDTGAIIEHDCIIGDFVNVSPNATLAGSVQVGSGSIVGIGAAIKENIKIGTGAVIGAGAVVIHDVPDFAIVIGTPAKLLRYRAADERTYK